MWQTDFTTTNCVTLIFTLITNVTPWGKEFLDSSVEQTIPAFYIEAADSTVSSLYSVTGWHFESKNL